MKMRIAWTLLFGVAFAALAVLRADEPTKSEPLTVIDKAGKEHKLTTWKFATDTRRLAWLAPKDKPTDAPEALEFREENSTTFAQGVLTLVPFNRLHSLEYDEKKDTVKLTAATGPKAEDKVTLTGSTGYKNTNRPTLEGQSDQAVKFVCGVEGAVKSIKFPAAKVEAQPMGRPAVLVTRRNEDGSTTHAISDFQALYRFADGRETLSPTLYCKTLKADLANKVVKITRTAGQGDEIVWVFALKGADDEIEGLLSTVKIDGKEATLVGMIGRVPDGYKLFPPLIVQEVRFDEKE